jgi:ATP-binding cassette, subfamily B, bacterial MsbA
MPIVKFNGMQTYLRLLMQLGSYWWQFVLGVIFTALASGIAAIFTWFLKPLLNKGFIAPDIHFIHWLPVIVLSAYGALASSAFFGDYFMGWVSRHVIMNLQRQLFSKYLQLPEIFFSTNTSGSLISKLIYNIEQVADACTKALLTIVKDLFYIVGLIIVMLSNSVLLTVIFFLTLPFVSLIVMFTAKTLKRLNMEVQDAVANITEITEQMLDGKSVINSFRGQTHEQSKFNKATWLVCKKQIQVIIANSLGSSSSRVVASVAIALSIYLATSPQHLLSAGAFISTIAAMISVLKPIRNITDINNVLQKGVAGAESVFAVLDRENETDIGKVKLKKIVGEISYKNVTFGYKDQQKPVLKNIGFKLDAGQIIAVVGRSGSGKSTLLKLLSRFYDIQSGDITIDGVSITEFPLDYLRTNIAVVNQDAMLFNDTVFKNIAYGQINNATREQVIEACKAAHALQFIEQLPNGFDTIIGAKGISLSGGQRQRIALARAFLAEAPIIVLDQPTSEIDSEAELHILTSLMEAKDEHTAIVIAHRLSTVKNADKILVLDDGQLVEEGTHRQLLMHDGHYKKLYNAQLIELNSSTG